MQPSDKKIQDIIDKHDERTARWKTLLETDPRRVVRVLTATGRATETIDGDIAWDAPYAIEHLKDASLKPQSAVWRGLVRAGIFAALCKCATTFRPAFLVGSNVPVLTDEEEKARSKELPSPWYVPLAIICTAAVNCALPPAQTERTMIEELKQNWSPIVQRIWSEPANSLGPEDERVLERAVVAQIVIRLSTIDPSFLETIFNSKDMTLPVCFRNWIHATARDDMMINNTVITTLLQPHLPSPWQHYLVPHPPPSPQELLSRMIMGATKNARPQKKRTEAQAAEFVAAAFTEHLAAPQLPLAAVLQELVLLRAFWAVAETELVPFLRAVAKCSELWAALPQVVRRAARAADAYDRQAAVRALIFYTDVMMHCVSGNGGQLTDGLIYHWVEGGLFDALDESVEILLEDENGPKLLTLIACTIDSAYSALRKKTRTALRAQLPRTGMVWKAIKIDLTKRGHEERDAHSHTDFGGRGIPDGRHPLWRQGSWEMFTKLAAKARGPDHCARRACRNKANGVQCATGRCKRTWYCSVACMERDREHVEMCSKNWFMIVERHHQPNVTRVAVQRPSAQGPTRTRYPNSISIGCLLFFVIICLYCMY